ncbi:LysR family transcriptional regulator [Mesorhizobium sp. M8A.F.Ca.ET.208.01.1.1]|uniref:LysR substrate-binding domain-containing protein n=1 Tax=unclassified Mesorhizobium TaxID=325217 RepID=UPI000FD34F11|nr:MULTISPECIES: LysR substrate-binding domain-containing protein [unclassified Mesorhizobium]RUW95316.1 LysR family transcriptional regulator [Mesorhizobium sp. M8A.F.Ca.ET.059.01.1.1]TGQ86215.1 LysR family transcriptional regulator [Mesorhizobium sp. M8A.F.Ca.ET.208.01.1.1]TGT47750.1 LysR family transcriptional regulator [Mesorhizobium sp. M8A.F.Ca.ET.167.01.1.1]TIT63059.1 MAG: LysR family transcriptional regulator [Mesorhizobium sp.]
MSWDLPPLGAIRVFEAASRLGSFTKAAEELGMTQSAASYQIKVLEERAGTPLFVRKTRQIALTEAGEQLAPHASGAFSALADAWVATKGGATGVLSVTTVQTFASTWLAVRLGAFQLMHPDLAVKVDTSSRLADFGRDGMDIGIRTGTGKWPGLAAHYLFKADYTPMLSPRLVRSVGGIRRPEDLYKLPLCCSTDPWWKIWFEAAGARFEPDRIIAGPELGTQAYDAMAALTDQGVAILTRNLYSSLLATGQLIQPFEAMGSDGDGYWLVHSESRRNTPKIRLFRDWVLAETADVREREQGRVEEP